MPSVDRLRFIYSLAGELLAGAWTADALKAVCRQSAAEHAIPLRDLAARILSAFAATPAFADLVRWLWADARLARALDRPAIPRNTRPKSRSLRPPRMHEPPARLRGIDIPALASEAALAAWLGVEPQHLRWRADLAGRNRKHPPGPMRTYRYRWIPKKQGPPRLLEIPKFDLKQMQRRILAEILDAVPLHPAVHGFRRQRSIVTNAAAHCAKAAVLRFDLADFFPSVSAVRVFRIFRTLGYPAAVARQLMGLCTTQTPADVREAKVGGSDGINFDARQRLLTRHLPQGAPTSPALANLAAGRMDRRLAGLAAATGATYTRYADDLTLSGAVDLARAAKRMEVLVAVIACEEGFRLNHHKTRVMRAGVRQHVTGVVVNVRPNITRNAFDRLKAILTNCLRHGPASQNREKVADFRAFLNGKVAHVAAVHPQRGFCPAHS